MCHQTSFRLPHNFVNIKNVDVERKYKVLGEHTILITFAITLKGEEGRDRAFLNVKIPVIYFLNALCILKFD